MATYAAQLEQYQKAVEIYEQVGPGGLLPCSRELGGIAALCPITGGPSAPEVVVMGSLKVLCPITGVPQLQKQRLRAPQCPLPHNWVPLSQKQQLWAPRCLLPHNWVPLPHNWVPVAHKQQFMGTLVSSAP